MRGGYAGCSGDEAFPSPTLTATVMAKRNEAACCGTALSSSSLGRRKAHTSDGSTWMSAHSVLWHHMRGQFSQQTEALPRRPLRRLADQSDRPPLPPHRNIAQEQEHRCLHQYRQKPRICCLFIRLPLEKS